MDRYKPCQAIQAFLAIILTQLNVRIHLHQGFLNTYLLQKH